MSLLDFFLFLTRLSFTLLALATLVDYLLHRDRARLDIALLFTSLAATLFNDLIRQTTGFMAEWLTLLAGLMFVAQPYLVLRVAEYFQPVPRLIRLGALAAMILCWAIRIFVPLPTPIPLVRIEVVYFVSINGYTAFLFVRGAFTTDGVTRQRLRLASGGTAFLAMLIALLTLAAFVPSWLEPITVALFAVAILSALTYFLAFAPPRILRQFWQLAELHHFLGQTAGQGATKRAEFTFNALCRTAERIVGGIAAVALWEPNENVFKLNPEGRAALGIASFPLTDGVTGRAWRGQSPQLAQNPAQIGLDRTSFRPELEIASLYAVPIRTPEHAWGLLLVALRHVPLFGQDDMNILSLLAEQSAIALDNAGLVQQQSNWIAQLQTVNESLERRVTERTHDLQLKQDELVASEARYRELFENSPQPMWVFDMETLGFLAVNDAAVVHYGYSRQEFLGMTLREMRSPDELPAFLHYLEEPEAPLAQSGPWKHRKKDGTLIDVETSSHIVTFGERPSRLVLVNDITLRLRAEQQARQAEAETLRLNQELEQRVLERTAQLQAANQELEAFSYSVSHDLRAPLRHINGYVEMVLKNPSLQLNEKGTQHLHIIANAALRMGKLIDALLDFARIGRTGMRVSPVNLDEMVHALIAEFTLETQGRDIKWETEPLPQVMGDPTMLRQVLQNLLANAVKYTGRRDAPCIQIGCSTTSDEQIIFVRDNGVGFDNEYVDKLFGVFQRLHSAQEFEGTGIGLANVRRIINRHGGRTWAEGAVDQGATFYFTLPLHPTPAPAEPISLGGIHA